MLKIRLKELRSELNITQEELAKKINLTRSSVAGYENGSKIPTIDTVILLSKFFNVSTDYLLGVSNTRNIDRQLAIDTENFIKMFKLKYDILDDNFKYAMYTISTNLIDNLHNLQFNNQEKDNTVHEDDDIARELESYRQELNSNNNKLALNSKNTNKKKA